MLINWFTVIAQIVNFLILVVLLKYLLYNRIVRAMDERESKIQSRLKEAEEKEEAAEREAESFRQKTGTSMRSAKGCSRRQKRKPTREESN